MNWQDVGNWLKTNGGVGVSLIGSLLTANVPSAIAAGSALVSSVVGKSDPNEVLANLQTDPTIKVKLAEIAAQENEYIRKHLEEISRIELEKEKAELADKQSEHSITQDTIQNGDNSDSLVIRLTRPFISVSSLFGALLYVLWLKGDDAGILFTLLTPPLTYMGVRSFDKLLPLFGNLFKKK